MRKRFLKIFGSKASRDAAIANNELDVNSVTIWGKDAAELGDGKIEFGFGNGDHQLNLGANDIDNFYDDNSSYDDSNND